MTVGVKHFHSALMGVAVIATLFGLVQAPLTASAMHLSMVDDFGIEMSVSDVPMTSAYMSMEMHEDSGCTTRDCASESACWQHCLREAAAHDAEVVPVPHVPIHIPAILPQRVTYPQEDEEPVHIDQTFSHTDAREILLTTHKRE